MLIKLSYQRKNGEPIKEDKANPTIITGTVFDPFGKKIAQLKFNKDRNGLLVADSPVDTSAKGVYKIVMTFKGGVMKFKYQQTLKISVIPIPYLEITSPSSKNPVHLGKTIPIEIKAKLAGKPLDVKSFFASTEHPDSLVMVTYKENPESDKYVSKHLPFKSESKDTFYMEKLTLDHSKQGSYLIKAAMNGTPAKKNTKMQEDTDFVIFQSVIDPAIKGNIQEKIDGDKGSSGSLYSPLWFSLSGTAGSGLLSTYWLLFWLPVVEEERLKSPLIIILITRH